MDQVGVLEGGGPPPGAQGSWPSLSCLLGASHSGLQLLQRGPLGVPVLHCGSAPSGFPLRRICYHSEVEEAASFGWREVPPWLAPKRSVLRFFAQYMQRWLQEVRSREGRGRVWISRGRGAVGHPHCRLGPC